MKIGIKGPIVSNDEAWIYDFFDMENTSPRKIADAIAEAKGDVLDIDVNSPGGDVFAGSEIYAALRAYDGQVNIHVVGIAASAASVIACAGHSDIAPTAQMMVHNVSSRCAGDYRDMSHASDVLQTANRAIAAAYVEKTGMTEQEALDMMDKETWLTAQDAVDKGLIDSIATSQQKDTADVKLVAAADGLIPQAVINKMQMRRNNLLDYFAN